MANPEAYEQKSADIDSVTLHLVLPIGADGAPGTPTRGREFVPSTPAALGTTGTYTISLREKWVAILGYSLNCQQATYSSSGACEVTLKTDSVNSAATFVVECRTAAGALVTPASGDILFLTVDLQKTKP